MILFICRPGGKYGPPAVTQTAAAIEASQKAQAERLLTQEDVKAEADRKEASNVVRSLVTEVKQLEIDRVCCTHSVITAEADARTRIVIQFMDRIVGIVV
jgi:hypothetical protein